MRVTVFGSASAKESDPAYLQGLELGRRIAEAGWTVITGGYEGTMAAVSRGAHEASGHVVGITMAPWARFEIVANRWVREEVIAESLIARLSRLVEADAFVALHGGLGTLTEVTLAWQLLQAWELPPAPLVAIGPAFRAIKSAFAEHLVVRHGDLDLLQIVDTPEDAVALLRAFDPDVANQERARVRAKLLEARVPRG
jgi:uncharacterized protein (TIGR00730 family)